MRLLIGLIAALTLAASPSDSFTRWLSGAVMSVTYHIPTQHVWIHVDRSQWEARMVSADMGERDKAIRRAVCFGIWDVAAEHWEWPPEKSSYEVYALHGGIKTVLMAGTVLNCTKEDAADLWPRPIPSHPAKHHHF